MAKKKPGRKRKQNVKRHPSGKIVQPKPNQIGVDARMRVLGLSKKQANSQEGGNALGIPLAAGEISNEQYDAGMEWIKAKSDYQRSILAMRMRSGSDLTGAGGFDGSDGTDERYVARCARDKAMYQSLRHAVLQSGAFGMMAMDAWTEHSNDALPLPYDNLGDYRLAANAINKAIRGKRKAA